jgi:hypothetical protein
MKKLILSFAMLVSLVATSFAAGTGKNPVETIFARQFAGAEHVKWSAAQDGLSKVTFTLAGIRTEAYYSQEAELLGTLRNLFYSQLPLSVMQTVNNKFTGGVVIEIMEITNAEGTSYRVILEQKEKKYTVRVNNMGEITEQSKMKVKKD